MELYTHPSREEIRAVASGVPQLFEDGRSAEDYEPNLDLGLWIGGRVNGECVATCHFIPRTSQMAEIHPAVLKPFRRDYAYIFTTQCMEIGLKHWRKILAVTPSCERTTINYAVKHGFKFEGVVRRGWCKNGELYPLVYMGYEVEDE